VEHFRIGIPRPRRTDAFAPKNFRTVTSFLCVPFGILAKSIHLQGIFKFERT